MDDISVPPTFPCYYDVAGKDYTSMQDVRGGSKPQLTKGGAGCLGGGGGALRCAARRPTARARRGRPATLAARCSNSCRRVPSSRRVSSTAAANDEAQGRAEPTPVAKVPRDAGGSGRRAPTPRATRAPFLHEKSSTTGRISSRAPAAQGHRRALALHEGTIHLRGEPRDAAAAQLLSQEAGDIFVA